MLKIRLSHHQWLYSLSALILALVAGYYINAQLIIREPEIFLIESESNDYARRFVIANPPKDGNQLVDLILQHEKTLNLSKEKKYYLVYFKETRRSPRNFDSRKNIPKKCRVEEAEPSCLDKIDVISGIAFDPNAYKNLNTKIPFINSQGLRCDGLVFYKDGSVWESGCKK